MLLLSDMVIKPVSSSKIVISSTAMAARIPRHVYEKIPRIFYILTIFNNFFREKDKKQLYLPIFGENMGMNDSKEEKQKTRTTNTRTTTRITRLSVVLLTSSVLLFAGMGYYNNIAGVVNKAYAQEQDQEDVSVREPSRQLTSQWWQWVLSIPTEDNPLLDTTGAECQQGDMGDVFFLVGTFGGSAERECTISEGQDILIPIINAVCLDLPGGLNPDLPGVFQRPKGPGGSCQETNESFMDTVDLSSLELTIDGVSFGSLEDFRVQSNPFPIRLPEDNLFGAPPGTYIGISDGIWVIVEGLPVGEHTIEFGGQADGFTVHVTYHLTVE
jgi:hypothetical protein